jgi:cytochrome c556
VFDSCGLYSRALERNMLNCVRRAVMLANAVLISAVMTTSVNAADEKVNSEQIIKHRQSVMMAIGGHMGATFGAMSLPEFADDQLYHIDQLNKLAKISAKTFPAGSGEGKTKSSADIWTKPDEFKIAMDDFLTKSQAAVDAAKKDTKSKEYLAAVKALTESCKSCHKKFKED